MTSLLMDQNQAARETASILVIDDDGAVQRAACRALKRVGHLTRGVATAAEAREALQSDAIDVVLLDINLPDRNGLDVLDELMSRRPELCVIMLTASSSRSDALESIRRGAASYLRKPFDTLTLEAQVDAVLRQKRRERRAQSRLSDVEMSLRETNLLLNEIPAQFAVRLTQAWKLRHGETGAHVRRIARYAEATAETLGFAHERAYALGCAAMLHDIGKIAIPDAILAKPGPLTASEFDVMKLHPVLGAEMLSGMDQPLFRLASEVARHHHERWDGSGYPDHLRGTDCPLEARIVAVVDVYDALTQTRCYKPAWSEGPVIRYFREGSGRLFDPAAVDALLTNIAAFRDVAAQTPDPSVTEALAG